MGRDGEKEGKTGRERGDSGNNGERGGETGGDRGKGIGAQPEGPSSTCRQRGTLERASSALQLLARRTCAVAAHDLLTATPSTTELLKTTLAPRRERICQASPQLPRGAARPPQQAPTPLPLAATLRLLAPLWRSAPRTPQPDGAEAIYKLGPLYYCPFF